MPIRGSFPSFVCNVDVITPTQNKFRVPTGIFRRVIDFYVDWPKHSKSSHFRIVFPWISSTTDSISSRFCKKLYFLYLGFDPVMGLSAFNRGIKFWPFSVDLRGLNGLYKGSFSAYISVHITSITLQNAFGTLTHFQNIHLELWDPLQHRCAWVVPRGSLYRRFRRFSSKNSIFPGFPPSNEHRKILRRSPELFGWCLAPFSLGLWLVTSPGTFRRSP